MFYTVFCIYKHWSDGFRKGCFHRFSMRSCYVKNLGFPFPILESCEPDDEPVDFLKWLGWLDRKFQLESNYIYMYLHPGKKHQRFQDLRPCSELCLFSGKERVVCSPVLRTAFCPRRWFNRGFLAFFWTWTKAYPKFWETRNSTGFYALNRNKPG